MPYIIQQLHNNIQKLGVPRLVSPGTRLRERTRLSRIIDALRRFTMACARVLGTILFPCLHFFLLSFLLFRTLAHVPAQCAYKPVYLHKRANGKIELHRKLQCYNSRFVRTLENFVRAQICPHDFLFFLSSEKCKKKKTV